MKILPIGWASLCNFIAFTVLWMWKLSHLLVEGVFHSLTSFPVFLIKFFCDNSFIRSHHLMFSLCMMRTKMWCSIICFVSDCKSCFNMDKQLSHAWMSYAKLMHHDFIQGTWNCVPYHLLARHVVTCLRNICSARYSTLFASNSHYRTQQLHKSLAQLVVFLGVTFSKVTSVKKITWGCVPQWNAICWPHSSDSGFIFLRSRTLTNFL